MNRFDKRYMIYDIRNKLRPIVCRLSFVVCRDVNKPEVEYAVHST